MNLTVSNEGTVSSLELLKEINFWRAKERENSEKEKAELRHDNLLSAIRDEFEYEISLLKIKESKYKNERGREYPCFNLTLSQAKQVLLRESKFVRRNVIKAIENTINVLKCNEKKYLSIIKPLEFIEFNGSVDDLVFSKNGKPVTTSRIISNKFNKEHREILRVIDNKIKSENKSIVQFCTVHITEVEYVAENGQTYREYELTEQGFSFIALGLTGENADIFKIDYINSFFKMRETLTNMFKAKVIEEVLPQDNRNRQYVYIIENLDNNAIKIGVAQDVDRRLKQLQTGSVSELIVVYRSNLCSNAFEVESFMHSNFKDNHIRGEWYDIDKNKVILELEKQRFVLRSEFINNLGLKEFIYEEFKQPVIEFKDEDVEITLHNPQNVIKIN